MSSVARADHPGRHAVDAGVEKVEADVHAAEEVAAHNLLGDRLQIVGEDHDVIAVPADAAADVQQDLVEIEQAPREILSAMPSVG